MRTDSSLRGLRLDFAWHLGRFSELGRGWQDVCADLVRDESRNDMIAGDLVRAVEADRPPLLLTGRTEHLSVFTSQPEISGCSDGGVRNLVLGS